MPKKSFALAKKASISLGSLLARKAHGLKPTPAARSSGFVPQNANAITESDRFPLLIEAADADKVIGSLTGLPANEKIVKLNDRFISAQVGVDTAGKLVTIPQVERVQTKKRSRICLTEAGRDVGLRNATGTRLVAETGKDVLIGIVDTGFDLSHPMFKDAGGKLRVAGLLDQTDNNKQYTTAQLETAWAAGIGPGADSDGHGTHVATSAGGSAFQGREGIAPEAKFLLVRTDFYNTDQAVQWLFTQAGNKPCVANLSLGHHWGAHDGTDAEERFQRTIIGKGKIIVVSAGNEREDRIHIGTRFHPTQNETVTFDVLPSSSATEPPGVILTLWYSDQDDFDITLVTPTGQQMAAPAPGNTDNYQSGTLDIEIARNPYAWSNLVQVQVSLSYRSVNVPQGSLRNWQVQVVCRTAVIGRLDGWFHNSGYAVFHPHPLVEESRTIGLTATGDACIAVASHATQNQWKADSGPNQDIRAVLGRSSYFSSMGPTRDGRLKPEISAPGQYLTAALADGSNMAGYDDYALVNQRLLSIQGTSMAAPVVSGIVALLLQKKGTLEVADIRKALMESARHDGHTGPTGWNPAYGQGKIDIVQALAKI